MQLVSTAS